MTFLLQSQAKKLALKKTVSICARWFFFLGSVWFLIHFAQHISHSQTFHDLELGPLSARLALGVAFISLANLTSALSWSFLLSGLSCDVGIKRPSIVYFVTQIGKYIPGNIGHYIGRVTLAKTRLKVTTTVTILSLLQETGLACFAALLTGFSCYFLISDRSLYELSRIELYLLFTLILLICISGITVADVLRLRRSGRSSILQRSIKVIPDMRTVVHALPSYIAGYICIGIGVSVIAASLLKARLEDFVLITGAYSLSWIIGFIIPGAPGGLGVRESALVVLLAGAYSKEAVLAIALLARLASVGADILAFIAGLLLMRKIDAKHASSINEYPGGVQ